MFIIFNTKKQAMYYIKRNNHRNYFHDEGCGCCYFSNSLFIDGNKVVESYSATHQGYTKASAVVVGRIKGR